MLLPTSLLKRALICATAVPFALLTGCALNSTGPVDTTITGIGGAVHGGQSPIQGATVNLYVTSNAATLYGQAATLIGTSTTDVNGNFTISPSATPSNCPAGQQAYITAAGGFPSGASALANTSVLQMAALGDCANVSASTTVIINEVTSVAAAYALSGFMTTSAVGDGTYQANVSAPSLNRAATGTINGAAGLAHAFLNATTLANYSTGAVNSQTANITMGSATVNGTIPVSLINQLGNILQSCVNVKTGDPACVSLFGFTPSITGIAPANTLQAMINLARNPYPSAAAMNTSSGLFTLASSTPAFQPGLTATPPDWSIAIVYRNAAMFAPYDLALDANDTVYQGGSGSAGLLGLSAYGVATPSFTAGTGSATRQLALDALGNIWLTNFGPNLYQYSATSGGAPLNTYTFASGVLWGVAVDKANNVWVGNAVLTSPNITELAYTTGSPATYAANYTSAPAGGFEPYEITVDQNQNVWVAAYFNGGTTADVLPNLSAATPAATPTYTVTGTSITPVSAIFASSAIKPLGVVIDSSGNGWYGITGSNSVTTTGIEQVLPQLSNSVITALSPQPLVATATLGAKASQIPGIDGAGSIYLPDNQGSGVLGIHVYSTGSVSSSDTGTQVLSPPNGYVGCYAFSSPTACNVGAGGPPPTQTTQATNNAVYNPREVAIDSTGAVWVGITSGGLTQLIGLGAPTWPLLQTAKPGVSPGFSAPTPLP